MNRTIVLVGIAAAALSGGGAWVLSARKTPPPPACGHAGEIERLRRQVEELEHRPVVAETRVVHEQAGTAPVTTSGARDLPKDPPETTPRLRALAAEGFSEDSARRLAPLLDHWEATLATLRNQVPPDARAQTEFHAAVQNQAAGALSPEELRRFAEAYPHLWGSRAFHRKKGS